MADWLGDYLRNERVGKELSVEYFDTFTPFEGSFRNSDVMLFVPTGRGSFDVTIARQLITHVDFGGLLLIPSYYKSIYIHVRADYASFAIIRFSREAGRRLIEKCKGLATHEGQETFLNQVHNYRQHEWLKEVIERYLFELATTRLQVDGAVDFLEVEILKELFFCRLKDLGRHFHGVLPSPVATRSVPTNLRRLIEYISRSLEEPLAVPDLACYARISEATLNRHFLKYFKISPAKFVRRMKLHRAKELVCFHGLKLADAADRMGYSSPSALLSAFQTEFGDSLSGSKHRLRKTMIGKA
ncbi:MAG: helix-turn-helix transcriptional regulator [Pseudobacteriovorax sp.]|nr:helix-turn-helix transcriptional regulator [Pseudobacteriovorax sp.]